MWRGLSGRRFVADWCRTRERLKTGKPIFGECDECAVRELREVGLKVRWVGRLMQAWADYLDSLKHENGNVVALRA